MIDEAKLSAVLSEFARTLITDFPIQGIVDHLVERIVEVLPVTSAGVTLISEGSAPEYLAASSDAAFRYERLQSEIGEGPCLAAFESGEAVSIPDLRLDGQFPRFAAAAREAGLAAVFTFPLRHTHGRLGALDLYRDETGELDAQDLEAAQTLADVAAAYVLNARAREDALTASDQFHHHSLHDSLTGLPNRRLLQERIEHAARRSERSRADVALLFVDIDRFKSVNDTYGHHVGDQLLLAIADRFSHLIRSGDTLARLSGDEFVFLCEDLHNTADVEMLAQRIEGVFASPLALDDGLEIAVTASVGVAISGPGESVSTTLLVRADAAMYQVKRLGGGAHRVVGVNDPISDGSEAVFEHDLRRAVETESFEIHYQPIVRSADGRITGVEALLRWTHPERGLVPTPAVIAVAELTGMIDAIGAWVLERSCRDRARWLAAYPDHPLDLAVNVSPHQLAGSEFVATVAQVLDSTGMDPAALILEVTETIFIDESERAMAALTEIARSGVRLALDDFGTGYSSLAYLRRMPIHIVKIDQAFIGDIDRLPSGSAIASAVTNLAHALGLSVVAEGVETQRQHDGVEAIGCDAAQGYLYARPMPADGIDALLGGLPH